MMQRRRHLKVRLVVESEANISRSRSGDGEEASQKLNQTTGMSGKNNFP
jgi:hypothetical protein